MQVRKIVVPRTARYMILGDPGPAIRRVWFVCHGYGQLAADFIDSFRVLNDGSQLVVAPEGLSRFYMHGGKGRVGASWMTREDRNSEISDYIEYLDRVYREVMNPLLADNPNPVRVEILGFSQGTATAWRWAVSCDVTFHRLILWGGDVPGDCDWDKARKRLQSRELLLVAGESDPLLKPDVLGLQVKTLARQGITVPVKTFPGGHNIDADLLKEFAPQA